MEISNPFENFNLGHLASVPISGYAFTSVKLNTFDGMAKRCTMGDLKAMMWMFSELRSRLPEGYEEEEKFYLNNKTFDEQSDWFSKYINDNSYEAYYDIVGSLFWLNRAAIYGSQEAKKLIEKYPIYEDVSYLSTAFQSHGRRAYYKTCPGETLRRIGLLDFQNDDIKYELSPLNNDNIYVASHYVDYDANDEDGFGMENYDDYYFFDEFFRILFKLSRWSSLDVRNAESRIKAACDMRKKKLEEERSDFWLIRTGDTNFEHYRELPPPPKRQSD